MEETVNFDNEVLAYLSVRKEELIESHTDYIASHPEIREVMNDFITSVLLHKPVSHPNRSLIENRAISLCTPRSISILSTLLPSRASLLLL
jgi:hypothetical protein